MPPRHWWIATAFCEEDAWMRSRRAGMPFPAGPRTSLAAKRSAGPIVARFHWLSVACLARSKEGIDCDLDERCSLHHSAAVRIAGQFGSLSIMPQFKSSLVSRRLGEDFFSLYSTDRPGKFRHSTPPPSPAVGSGYSSADRSHKVSEWGLGASSGR